VRKYACITQRNCITDVHKPFVPKRPRYKTQHKSTNAFPSTLTCYVITLTYMHNCFCGHYKITCCPLKCLQLLLDSFWPCWCTSNTHVWIKD